MQSFERKTKNTKSVKRAQQVQATHQQTTSDKVHNFKPIRQQKQEICIQDKEALHKSQHKDKRKEISTNQAQESQYYKSLSTNHKSPKTQFFSKQIQEELQALRDEINDVTYSGRNNYNQQSQGKSSQRTKDSQVPIENGISLYTINKKKQRGVDRPNKDLLLTCIEDDKAKTQRIDTKVLQLDQQKQREDSKNKYSAVKSKVRSNLRSKTPKALKRDFLSKQQKMDQQDKLSKREQQIVRLENEVFKNQNDLEFKSTNKDRVLQTYKSVQRTSIANKRKSSDPQLVLSSNDEMEGNDSTDESTKVNLNSKKQFSEIEFQLRDTEFSDKYFDKVYLELCGFNDLKSAQQDLIEMHKDSSRHRQQSCQNAIGSSRFTQQNTDDIVGSITFIERRSDKIQKTQRQSFQDACAQQDSQVVVFDAFNVDKSQQKSSHQVSQQRSARPEIYIDQCSDDSQSQIEKQIDLYVQNQDNSLSYQASDLGEDQFKNKRDEMRQQNQQLVEDFDKVFDELIAQRKTASHLAFYQAIHEYDYDKKQLDQARFKDSDGQFIQAHSPTKRLICMKNSQIEHMKQIKDRNLLHNGKAGANATNMVYMASPERSYVVKSNEKIDYALAFKKNPSKFYEKALNAPITKHRIMNQRDSVSPKATKKSTLGSSSSQSNHSLHSQHLLSTGKKPKSSSKRDHEVYTIVSKTTTRPHNRINQKIKSKIEQKLADKLGSALTSEVLKALEEANIQGALDEIMSDQQSKQHAKSEQKAQKQAKCGSMSHRSYQLTQQQQNDKLRSQGREQQQRIMQDAEEIEQEYNQRRRMTQSYKDLSQIPQDNSSKALRERSASMHKVQRKKSLSQRSGTSSKQFASENYEDIAWERQ